MKITILIAALWAAAAGSFAAVPPFLDERTVAAIAEEISGESAKRHLEALSRQHRMRGSHQFRAAAQHIENALKGYGFTDAHLERLPADGKVFYGTQRSRPAWNAEFAELWEIRRGADGSEQRIRLASWDAMPITLAQDSESGEATTELMDVGAGTSEADYAGKDVRGKLVLASAQPGPVARLAVDRYGAAGIVSYAQNQRTAWWGENENLVRWGHLDTFGHRPTFAFMVSLKQARDFQQRLGRGETIRLHALVRAGKEPGFYEIATATIAGSDPALRSQEIVYSCHLDHPRPGANDNASGCATILEVARTLRKLIDEKRLQPPARTIRFVWPPEIEGTLALLNSRPELASRIRAAIHLDMVGGGPETKAIFHVTRGPGSLPSFIHDVAEEIGRFVNDQTARNAMTGTARFALVAAEGGKEALQAELVRFTMGSDHQVYTDSSFGIPAIYLNDWPDRYIHTNLDLPAHIDPTKLKRAGFIAGAAGYLLATMGRDQVPAVLQVLEANALRRSAETLEQQRGLSSEEAANVARFQAWYESAVRDSVSAFVDGSAPQRPARAAGRSSGLIYRRNPAIRGPMSAFGYDYVTDKYGEERAARIRLLPYQGLRGSGGEYAYEVLNLVDGRRTVGQIRDDVSAIYGPVPLELVAEYLAALESIGVVLR